ncbi:MAG: hypothetical protein P8Y28_15520 [Gammaproteobacteria bacterium]|jgi:hypothetical protein
MYKNYLKSPALMLLALIVVYAKGVAAEQVYKSEDAEGNVTYSSVPPENAAEVQEVSVPRSSPSSGGSDSVEDIERKANQLQRENAERQNEIRQNKDSNTTNTEVVVDEEPVSQPRPIIQNRPINKPPAVSPPVVAPAPR